jgi:hypothetical protein
MAAASRPPTRPRAAGLLLVIVPILAMVGFIVGIVAGVRGEKIVSLALAIVTALVAFVPLAIDQARRPEDRHLMLSLIALAYMGVFVVPVFSIYLPADGPVEPSGMNFTSLHTRDVMLGQLISLAGLIALLVAYALPFGTLMAGLFPKARHDWPLRSTFLVGCAMIPFGWAIQLIAIFGFLPAQVGSGLVGSLSLSAWFGLVLLSLSWFRYRSHYGLFLLAVLVPTTMIFFGFGGSKQAFLRPLMFIVLTSWLYRRQISGRWILAGVAAIVVLYPAAHFYRHQVQVGRSIPAMLADPVSAIDDVGRYVSTYSLGEYVSQGLVLMTNRFDGLGRSSAISRDTPDRVPFQGGWTLALIPIAYVPRLLWPDKPETTIGNWITETYGSGTIVKTATGPSWVGEFYLNFGVAGVVGGMFVMGFLLRLLQEGVLRSATVPAIVAGVVALEAVALSMQGGVIGSVNGVTFSLAPLFATHLALRYMGWTVPTQDAPAPGPRPRAFTADTPPVAGGLRS